MKILLFISIFALSFSAFASDCEDNSYILKIDPNGTASKAHLMHVIRVVTDYSNGLTAGDLKVNTAPYPVLTVNHDSVRGTLDSYNNAIAMLQANPGVRVECSTTAVID
jgi:hypothetical protein